MADSFRLTPNSLKAEGAMLLQVEGLGKPKDFVDKSCTIQILEIDKGQDRGGAGKVSDLLAEFSATIRQVTGATPPQFYFESVNRTDSFPRVFPVPAARPTPEGQTLTFVPDWKPPHFFLSFETHPVGLWREGPRGLRTHLILLREETGERERYVYEIGFKVSVGGKKKFESTKSPTLVDCNALLANNCRTTALMMKADHEEMVALSSRKMGTHFGSVCGDARRGGLSSAADLSRLAQAKVDFRLKSLSCITYQTHASEIGHAQTLAKLEWKKIAAFAPDLDGQNLFRGYEDAGWVGLYYNPDTENPKDRDNPCKPHEGHHRQTVERARDHHAYGYKRSVQVRVHDMIINYRPTTMFDDIPARVLHRNSRGRLNNDGEGTEVKRCAAIPASAPAVITPAAPRTKIDKLKGIPFAVMIMRDAVHTAMLIDGKVFEVHWDVPPWEAGLFEATDFESDWGWLSGMIMVPRGLW